MLVNEVRLFFRFMIGMSAQLQTDWRDIQTFLKQGCASIIRGAFAKAEAGLLSSRFLSCLDPHSSGQILRQDFEEGLFEALSLLISPRAIVLLVQESLGQSALDLPMTNFKDGARARDNGGSYESSQKESELRASNRGLPVEGMMWREAGEGVDAAFTPRTRGLLYPNDD